MICDAVITIPAFLLGGLWGYKHRVNENKKMIREHEASMK